MSVASIKNSITMKKSIGTVTSTHHQVRFLQFEFLVVNQNNPIQMTFLLQVAIVINLLILSIGVFLLCLYYK